MKSFTIFIVLLFMPAEFAQQSPVKMITNFEFDSRNPVILSTSNTTGDLFFEGIQDSSVNIFSLKYDAEKDSFIQLNQISSGNYVNRNAAVSYVFNYPALDYKILLWETNQRGNWDIAFSADSGNGWTNPELILDSDEDEIQPAFAQRPYFFSFNESLEFIYTKGNSVYLFKKDSVQSEQIIFEGNDTVRYSNPGYTNLSDYVVSAERRINGGDPYIVYRRKSYLDSVWSEIKEAFPEGPAENPKFSSIEGQSLSFEIHFGSKRKFVWINMSDLGGTSTIHELLDDQSIETSDFSMIDIPVITKAKDYFAPYNPHAFRYVKNDSTFIRNAVNNVYDTFYVDVYTKVGDCHPALDMVSVNINLTSYTIWEDSANGCINLFGLKRTDPFGEVKKEFSPDGFFLSQNYPNPFNPDTKIVYAISRMQFVSLKVFDLLGREIKTLVNEEKPGGEYIVEFNASSLSSSIYFYQLRTSNSVITKKMIYLK